MSDIATHIALAERPDTALAECQVEVIADLVCPFCYLGKRQLDEAMLAVKGPSEVIWYPFQVNPQLPADGVAFDDYLGQRFGGRDKIQPVLDKLVAEGRKLDIEFRFDRIQRVPSTLAAHQLMSLADDNGTDQTRLAEMLMHAFFERGEDIGDADVLTAIGLRAGLRRDAIVTALTDPTKRSFVLARESQVRQSGITGVPAFLVNRSLLVVGAQTADHLVNVFDRAMFGEIDDTPAEGGAELSRRQAACPLYLRSHTATFRYRR